MTPTDSTPKMGRREWVLLLILSAVWGSSFFFFKVLVAELPPLTVVLGRVGLAAVALNLFLALRGERMPRSPRLWGAFLVMGLLNNVVPFTLIVFGETRISSGLASILNATTPIFTVLAADRLTTTERLTRAKGIGVLCGFAGVAVLIGPAALRGLSGGDVVGEAACLLAALSYAFAGIFGRRFAGIPPLKVATGQITASTAVLIPLALIVDRPWTLAPPSAAAWSSLITIAILCTAIAYMFYFRILATAGATNLLLVTFLLPISALLLGAAFLGETVSLRALAGMGLIGLGLAAIDGRVPRAVLAAVTARVRSAPYGPPAARPAANETAARTQQSARR
jgi:drug/metabolite transporter (DMT)-like permease